jgi:outer membrane immunogenic protein
MKKFLVAGIAAAAFCGAPALAADVAVKAPPPAPAPVVALDWTGPYLDGDIGWQGNSYKWNTNDPASPNFNSIFSLSNSVGSFGGHLGYQQQFGWLVVGEEVGTFASIKRSFASVTSGGLGAGVPCGLAFAGQMCQVNLDRAYTFGGKAGVVWSDWVFYGVGGYATGVIESQINLVGAALAPGLADTTTPKIAQGWYAGAGFDYMLSKSRFFDAIIGIEYQHVALGAVQEISNVMPVGFPLLDQRTLSADVDAVWAKLTLKFNPFAR